jgi:hypothetical protein
MSVYDLSPCRVLYVQLQQLLTLVTSSNLELNVDFVQTPFCCFTFYKNYFKIICLYLQALLAYVILIQYKYSEILFIYIIILYIIQKYPIVTTNTNIL